MICCFFHHAHITYSSASYYHSFNLLYVQRFFAVWVWGIQLRLLNLYPDCFWLRCSFSYFNSQSRSVSLFSFAMASKPHRNVNTKVSDLYFNHFPVKSFVFGVTMFSFSIFQKEFQVCHEFFVIKEIRELSHFQNLGPDNFWLFLYWISA